MDPSLTARMRPVTGCWPLTAPPPPPNPARAPFPPRAPVPPVAPVAAVAGVCDLSNVMPAANPPPARASAATTPITICCAFNSKPLCSWLFVSECLDRMEPRGAHRRVETEDDPDRDRNADRDDYRAARHEERDARRRRNLMNDLRDRPAEHDPENTAEPGERDR